jgi:hypothetical protein
LDNNEVAKSRVKEVLTESVREEVGISPEVFEALEGVMVEAVSKVLDDVLAENEELMAANYSLMLDQIFDEFTRGLSLVQKDKLYRLQDSFDLNHENPFEDYRLKLADMVDAMTPAKVPSKSNFHDESFNPQEDRATYEDPIVKHYAAVSNWVAESRKKAND